MTVRATITRGLLLLAGAVLVVTLGARRVVPAPDLVAVVVGTLALRHGWRTGAALGLAGGWLLDLLPPGGEVLGLSALTYAVGGTFAGRLRRLGPVPLLLVVGAVALTTVVVDGAAVVIALARGVAVDLPGLALHVLVTATAGLVLGPVILHLDGITDGRRRL